MDYVAKGVGDERKLLRVIVGPKRYASNASVRAVEDTLKQLKDEEYDKATIVANSFTSASKRLVCEEDVLDTISLKESSRSTTKVFGANQSLVMFLCKTKCGGLPKTEEDCEGLVDGDYICKVRRISDDSDFHSRMGWLHMLMNDFSKLIELQRDVH